MSKTNCLIINKKKLDEISYDVQIYYNLNKICVKKFKIGYLELIKTIVFN